MAGRTKVAIVAFGMEHCKRGVEAHARMFFEKLKQEDHIDALLVKGSGASHPDEVVLSVPKRHTWLNRALGKIRGYNIYWEQVFFLFRLAFFLLFKGRELDYIYTQEYVHMVGMGRLKSLFGLNYKLVYCEGFVSSSEVRLKYAQVLQEINKGNFDRISDKAEKRGIPCHLIPHFFDPIWEDEQVDQLLLNELLHFKGDDKLMLYVGPTELEEKNFIRLEEAVGALESGWKLLICGNVPESRTRKLNGLGGAPVRTVYVSHAMMQRIYPMADLFVLPSIDEAFGIATIEAMGHGVPVLLHDSSHSLWLCNDPDQCVDMTIPHAVQGYIARRGSEPEFLRSKGELNQDYFLKTFTWEILKDRYLSLFVD